MDDKGVSLEQWCRALAAHAMLVAYPDKLHEFLAPEISEGLADFILRFARGETVARPALQDD